MAYANLIAVSCNNPIETFLRFRDFMCKRNGTYDYSTTGIGWTLHDAVYAVNENTISINDYFVMYSPGEDGQRDLYFKVLYKSGYIDIIGYLYWNNTTHAGVQSYAAGNNWTNTLATNNVMWVYGDLDNFIGIAKYATSYYSAFGGWMPDSPISQAVTVAPNAITAGSSVAVTFTAVPGEWAIGTKLFVRDTANIERVVIAGIAGDIVTFSAFVSSYAAGSKFALENTNHIVNTSSANAAIALQIDHAGTKNSSANPDNPAVTGPASGDSISGKYTAKRVFYSGTTMWIGPIKNQLSTLASFTPESTHTGGATNYRFFVLYSARNVLIEEV